MLKTLLLLCLLNPFIIDAKEILYLGLGRYSCVGGGCDEFNASQRIINRINERQDAEMRDYKDEIRAQEFEEKLNEIERRYDYNYDD